MAAAVREPVHPDARLRVVAAAPYTEMAGTAVAAVPGTGDLVVLTADSAVLVARLDGRPLRQSLAPDLAMLTSQRWRQARELLRRLKATGLLEDAAPGDPPRPALWAEPAPEVATVQVRGRLEAGLAGRRPTLVLDDPDLGAHRDGTVTVGVDPEGRATVDTVRSTLPEPPSPAPTAAAGSGPPAPRAAPTTTPLQEPSAALLVLAALTRALEPIEQLTHPGVFDLLATLAEHAARDATA